MTQQPLLTDDELRALDLTAELVGIVFQRVMGHNGPIRDGDVREFVAHIHAIQNMIMAQAAGRAYPTRFRLLGEHLDRPEPTP